MASCAWPTSSRSSSGARSATRLSWRRTAVRVCPTSSCSSRAMRCRSRSCADSARAAPVARSASSRSSIVLYVVISSAVSAGPATTGARSRGAADPRWPWPGPAAGAGRGRSAARARWRRAAAPGPPSTTRASPGRTGVDTVTGPSSSAAATTRPAALSEKIRQNSDTVLSALPVFACAPASRSAQSPPSRRRSRISVTTPISPPYGDGTCGLGPPMTERAPASDGRPCTGTITDREEQGEETCLLHA